MHELGIVFHVIDTVEKIAKEQQVSHVQTVTMEVGEVSVVVPEYLQDCWDWAVSRTELMKGCALKCETIKAQTCCDGCGETYETVVHGRICPYCGSEKTWLLVGSEVNIKEIEVDG